MTKSYTTILLAAAFAIAATACGKKDEQAAAPAAEPAAPAVVLTAPTTNDLEAWKAYMKQELTPYIDRRYRRPYVYFVPMVDEAAPDKEEQLRQYTAQLENAQNAVGRGIQAGSMIAFGGPASEGVRDVVLESFKLAGPKSLKGVRVVVIATPDVKDAIQAAVTPSEADFVWIDRK
jgi:hypothetical protein